MNIDLANAIQRQIDDEFDSYISSNLDGFEDIDGIYKRLLKASFTVGFLRGQLTERYSDGKPQLPTQEPAAPDKT